MPQFAIAPGDTVFAEIHQGKRLFWSRSPTGRLRVGHETLYGSSDSTVQRIYPIQYMAATCYGLMYILVPALSTKKDWVRC